MSLALHLALVALTAQEPEAKAQSEGTYEVLFRSAVAALDAGELARATKGFEEAGALAPDAPVWRVYVALGHLRAGDAATARALAREALERAYPASDLVAIEPELLPTDVADVPPSELGKDGARSEHARTGVALVLPPPLAPVDGERGQHRIARGPTRHRGPEVRAVHVRDSDDAVFVQIGDGWRRLDLERLVVHPPDGDMALVGAQPWAKPKMQPPDTAVRDRIFALVGRDAAEERVPITLAPRGDAWLYFQEAGFQGTVGDILNVVDKEVTRVVASLARPTDGMGPISYWPPYFSPSGEVLAVSGWWGASLHVFDARDWSRRWEVGPRVDKGTSGGCHVSLPNENRLYAIDSCGINTHLCECYDLRTGAVLFRGEDLGFMTMDGMSDDRFVVSSSVMRPRAVQVLDGRDFTPLLETWFTLGEGGALLPITFAADGTFDAIAPAANDLVAVGEPSLGASPAAVAPWLLDPLHVRTFYRDTDRAARPVPRSLLRTRAAATEPTTPRDR
jgi:hypothetical protein